MYPFHFNLAQFWWSRAFASDGLKQIQLKDAITSNFVMLFLWYKNSVCLLVEFIEVKLFAQEKLSG